MSAGLSLLPWHSEIFSRLDQFRAQDRLGHAWLFSGLAGSGKLTLARFFAQTLLCEHQDDAPPCGSCRGCLLFLGGNHPDWQLIQPEKRLITIDQIRAQLDFANQTSQRGGMKVLVIKPAEAMNLNAANALLKLLEEPPPQTLLILISHQPGLLLATLRSRCQHLRCPTPALPQAVAWLKAQGFEGDSRKILQLANGAPLHALHLTESGVLAEHENISQCLRALALGRLAPLQAARQCEKFSVSTCIENLMQAVLALLKMRQTGQSDPDPELQSLAELLNSKVSIMGMHSYYRSLLQARKDCLAPNNANQMLILEDLLVGWSRLAESQDRS